MLRFRPYGYYIHSLYLSMKYEYEKLMINLIFLKSLFIILKNKDIYYNHGCSVCFLVRNNYFLHGEFILDVLWFLAQLDGVTEKAIKRLGEHHNINDWLELSESAPLSERDGKGRKRVRWADLEERKAQMKMRNIGFVVGQTNWNRMLDPTDGSAALTRTKIIPNRFQNRN